MEITYLCPAIDHPVGGIKVIYKHAEMLSAQGFKSSVLHTDKPDFRCSWFENKAVIRQARPLVPGQDFVVIPEIWALQAAEQCRAVGLDYAIFVQGGYLLNSGIKPAQYASLQRAYEQAQCILSISADTSEMIRVAFPSIPQSRIIRLLPHIGTCFSYAQKQRIIAYMPRRLGAHAEKLRFYLREHLPANWSLVPISGRTEAEVARILARSSIFLSFCDQEGCPLPPLEAAFSGALVIGYTGQGAREYFRQPNFLAIQNGDFRSFVAAVTGAIPEIERGLLGSPAFLDGIKRLRRVYGPENEVKHLRNFANTVLTPRRASA